VKERNGEEGCCGDDEKCVVKCGF